MRQGVCLFSDCDTQRRGNSTVICCCASKYHILALSLTMSHAATLLGNHEA